MRYKIHQTVIGLSAQRLTLMLTMALTLSISACGEKTPTPQAPNQQAQTTASGGTTQTVRVPTIVFLGDSLTAGYRLAQEEALPEQVEKQYRRQFLTRKKFENFTPFNIVNAGVSGDTTANGLARYDWSVKSANPNIVVIALGANDFLQNLDPKMTRENLERLITLSKKEGYHVILAGIKPRGREAGSRRAQTFAKIYPELAKKHNITLFPALLKGLEGRPGLVQSDGAHPTAKGVEVMATRFSRFLKPILDEYEAAP